MAQLSAQQVRVLLLPLLLPQMAPGCLRDGRGFVTS